MKQITVNDSVQQEYVYFLTVPEGKNFDQDFAPELTPPEMLRLGVFDGKYFDVDQIEFPKYWFSSAKIARDGIADPSLNYFKIHASQPLSVWQKKGWINPRDPRGWFQWYCRYYLGRRMPDEDFRQIKRWKAIKRHIAQVKKNCMKGDLACRPKQRQAILHWAYDSRKM